MPGDFNKEAYPEPPERNPVISQKSTIPNPAIFMAQVFHYTVDAPVTAFRGVLDSLKIKNRPVYYHRKFRRVPYLTECEEGDDLCYYEADMQWKRDFKVDQEVVKIIQERMRACHHREGYSYEQNCAKEIKDFENAAVNYARVYGELGAYGNARKCLMKQKERMIAAQESA